MQNIEIINKMYRNEFNKNKNVENLKNLVMSELISPIEDYCNAVELLKDNLSLINNNELLFIGAYCISWLAYQDNIFLDILNTKDDLSNFDQAIVYYLNAFDIKSNLCTTLNKKQYNEFLLKSIALSGSNSFCNNKLDLSKVCNKSESIKLINQAKQEVKKIYTQDEIQNLPNEFWLNPSNFINEFILGTHITRECFDQNFT